MPGAVPLLVLLPLVGGDAERHFQDTVRPLLARRCFACHGNDEETREAGLRLDTFEGATAEKDGFAAIVPGDVEASEVWWRVIDETDPMPPEHAGEPLDDAERAALRRWIEDGAPYARHWSFEPAERPEVPAAPEHPIDAFVLERLGAHGLDLSPRADDRTLLRRLSLDITGLPPTPDEVEAFVASNAPDKTERAIERLLDSPAYAERWAAVWLDLARYADSSGHGSDPLRTIWRYRDWVIEAYDQDLPYDVFLTQQLAGDLLPDADADTRLATAFHRNTMTNTEGGTDDEEFRVLAVKDRVNTTLQVTMGLTAQCAECHSHKYDPISQREYYALFDVFNQTADTDRNDDAPRMPTPTPAQRPEWERLSTEIAELDAALAGRRDALVRGGAAELGDVLSRVWPREGTHVLHASDVRGDGGEAVLREADGTVFVADSGPSARRSAFVPAAHLAPRSLVLEARASEALPRGGPGRNSASGNFVLTQLDVRAFRPGAPAAAFARRVRIELPGRSRYLSLAEVEAFGPDGTRIAFAGASQSSTDFDGPAALAIDGNRDGAYENGSVTHTALGDDPWWEGTFDGDVEVASVRVWSRTDQALEERLHGFRVRLVDASGSDAWVSALAPAPGPSLDVGPASGEPLRLEVASVTHEQPRFEARRAVDGRRSTQDGWAVGGGEGRDQTAIFSLPDLAGPASLQVDLEHAWGTDHVLGRFRVSIDTADEPPLALGADVRAVLARPADERSDEDRRRLADALGPLDAEVRALEARRGAALAGREALGVTTTPVMVQLPADQRRTTRVLRRGNFLDPAEVVTAAVPAAFGTLDPARAPDRLALAEWLVAPENPLTARVQVNRVWARLFGRGLVRTEGDFGSQGALPTHPELLDWLAVEFREGDWSQRALLRRIVTSRTYQQASDVTPVHLERDPDAALLSRYPRQRLEAEMVRDAALRAAGLLSEKRFGPSVFPPQPAGMWQAAFNGERDWTESTGADRYRRGLYVFLRRTIPYPMLETFDAPSRELCTVNRIPTNTPLQSFVTLNDPVFVEAAQALGRLLIDVADERGTAEALRDGALRSIGRPLSAAQSTELDALLKEARTAFAADPEGATRFASDPLGPLPEGADPIDAAAWTLVASTLLNLDAALTKE